MVFTPSELAEKVKCQVEHIYSRIKSGDLPAINIGSDKRPTYRVTEEDWQAFLDKRRVHRVEPSARRRRRPQMEGVTEFFQ